MINSGTILIKKDAMRPKCFSVEDESCPNAWMRLKHSLGFSALDVELSAAGWTFFYMANQVTATAFGFNRAKAIQAALKRIVANVSKQKCNCVEIDEVVAQSFLGIPYITISAHPRHIQSSMVFSGV